MKAKLAGLVALGVIAAGGPALAQRTYNLTVSKHGTVTANNATVTAILARASSILQTDDDFAPGNADVACDVTLTLQGSVTNFANAATPARIVDNATLTTVLREPAFVKMVTAIGYCGNQPASYAGCAYTPGRSIAVVHPIQPASAAGSVWAHEFGHSTGLNHRAGARLLMNPSVGDEFTYISTAECASYLRGPPARAVPGARTLPGRRAADERPPVEALVRMSIVDEMPYRMFEMYSAGEAASAQRLLDESDSQRSWPTIMTLMGVAGNADAEARIIRYLETEARPEVDPAIDEQTRVAALYALGYQLNRTGSPRALAALQAVAGVERTSTARSERDEALRRVALWGLALSGRREALAPMRGAARGLSRSNTSELERVHSAVARRGLASFYESSQRR